VDRIGEAAGLVSRRFQQMKCEPLRAFRPYARQALQFLHEARQGFGKRHHTLADRRHQTGNSAITD
jgi:hypothetical protein